MEDERNSGLSTKLDWIQKNRELHRAVTEELFLSDDLARAHVVLESLHRKRRLDATLVVEETELLDETVEKTRRQNAILKDKLGTLECELSLAQAKENRVKAALRDELQEQRHAERLAKDQDQQQRPMSAQSFFSSSQQHSSSASSTRPTSATNLTHHHNNNNKVSSSSRPGTSASNYTSTSSGSTDEVVAAEAQTLFDRISQTISIESRNLQTARHAHVEALKQRTELEVYLKHAILAYQSQLENLHYSIKQGLKADSGGTGVNNNKNYMKPLASKQQQSHQEENSTSNSGTFGVHKVKKVEPTVFTVEDRQAVVDSLLSLPRVLTLMFDPVAAANRIRKKQEKLRELRSTGRGGAIINQQLHQLNTSSSSSRRNQQLLDHNENENENIDGEDNENDLLLANNQQASVGSAASTSTKAKHRATADQKLFDDLAKLGVDVVGSQTRFMFASSSSQYQQQNAEEEEDEQDDNHDDDDPEVGGENNDDHHQKPKMFSADMAPAPPDEEELWERWNQWSKEAEHEISSKKTTQQKQKRR